jgi:hypothetical protein
MADPKDIKTNLTADDSTEMFGERQEQFGGSAADATRPDNAQVWDVDAPNARAENQLEQLNALTAQLANTLANQESMAPTPMGSSSSAQPGQDPNSDPMYQEISKLTQALEESRRLFNEGKIARDEYLKIINVSDEYTQTHQSAQESRNGLRQELQHRHLPRPKIKGG